MSDVLTAEIVVESEQPQTEETTEQVLVEEELLVEDVSIDGMCGVY